MMRLERNRLCLGEVLCRGPGVESGGSSKEAKDTEHEGNVSQERTPFDGFGFSKELIKQLRSQPFFVRFEHPDPDRNRVYFADAPKAEDFEKPIDRATLDRLLDIDKEEFFAMVLMKSFYGARRRTTDGERAWDVAQEVAARVWKDFYQNRSDFLRKREGISYSGIVRYLLWDCFHLVGGISAELLSRDFPVKVSDKQIFYAWGRSNTLRHQHLFERRARQEDPMGEIKGILRQRKRSKLTEAQVDSQAMAPIFQPLDSVSTETGSDGYEKAQSARNSDSLADYQSGSIDSLPVEERIEEYDRIRRSELYEFTEKAQYFFATVVVPLQYMRDAIEEKERLLAKFGPYNLLEADQKEEYDRMMVELKAYKLELKYQTQSEGKRRIDILREEGEEDIPIIRLSNAYKTAQPTRGARRLRFVTAYKEGGIPGLCNEYGVSVTELMNALEVAPATAPLLSDFWERT